MANEVVYSRIFIRKAKELKKRHPSLVNDLEDLEKNLLEDPRQGADLGAGLYKVRLAVKSKGKGKSGGYRIITFLVSQSNSGVIINMLTIYDKADENSIDKKYLLSLIKELFNS